MRQIDDGSKFVNIYTSYTQNIIDYVPYNVFELAYAWTILVSILWVSDWFHTHGSTIDQVHSTLPFNATYVSGP